MATDGRVRLDQPVTPRRVVRPTYDPEAFGRLSERVARFIGTGRFLVFQTGFIFVWIVANVFPVGHHHLDHFPFIFLTLLLSLQAAYAAPLILLAQNRQDDRDRVNLEQDRSLSGRQLAETEFVAREVAAVRIALGDVVTRDYLRSELRALLAADEDRAGEPRADNPGESRKTSAEDPQGARKDASPAADA